MLYVVKRDGRVVEFDGDKIVSAILGAFNEVDKTIDDYAISKANNIANYIEEYIRNSKELVGIEKIQDLCESGLMATKRKDVARAYITYRNDRTRIRGNTTDKDMFEVLTGESEY